MKILLLDIAWLAGILEGEGCFKIQSSGGYKGSIAIALQMTDKDIVDRVANLLNSPVWGPHGPYGKSKLQTYQTIIFGKKAASWMMTLFPFLGNRRQNKIIELLEIYKKQQVILPSRKPKCHPEREYSAKGMCHKCYMKFWHTKEKNAYPIT